MNIHEYQAKELLGRYGIAVPRGGLAETADGAVGVAKSLSPGTVVVKAQVHAGGRGKAGGIRVCRSLSEVETAAREILSMRLVTRQTGPEGRAVRRVWIEEGTDIVRELYLAVVLNRSEGRLCLVASACGGMDIEEVAAENPGAIHVAVLGSDHRIWPFQARRLMFACGVTPAQAASGTAIARALVRLCREKDATMAEINPLAVDANGELVALDAKIGFDESALYRHPDIAALADDDELEPLEKEASALGLSYVHLSGDIGTLVNGAGLAMATMDAIKKAGGEPANFLDAGGGADAEHVARGISLIVSNPRVRGILVNVFGGILRCDIVAAGLVLAAGDAGYPVPVVVRLEGTNVEEAKGILKDSGMEFHSADSMDEASRKIVQLAREAKR